MALHPEFPGSPYELLRPEHRWFPADEALRAKANDELLPPLVAKVQDDVRALRPTGNLFLTNIHRVFLGEVRDPSLEDDDLREYFLGDAFGAKPVGRTTDSKTDLGEIVREIEELEIFNDEAHHIHDSRLAWFKSIQDIHHKMLQKDCRLSLQVDVIQADKPLPDRFRFLLFADRSEVELVWNGKTRGACTALLTFQTLEHIDEPRKEAGPGSTRVPRVASGVSPEASEFEPEIFDTGGRQVKGWTNKLIRGDNKLILSSLKSGALRRPIDEAGGHKLITIDPPFGVGTDFSLDIEIGGETFHKEPNLLEQIACPDTGGRFCNHIFLN